MPLTSQQALLIDELHALVEDKDMQSLTTKSASAAHMLGVIEHFGSLNAYLEGIHEHNGNVVKHFEGIARHHLYNALSFEHPGLNQVLQLFHDDHISIPPSLATPCTRRDYLKSTPAECQLTVVAIDLSIPHSFFTLASVFPEWFGEEVDWLFSQAEAGDKRFATFYRHLIRGHRLLEPINSRHLDLARKFYAEQIEKTLNACHGVDIRLDDPRRRLVMGAQTSVDECLERFIKVVRFFCIEHFGKSREPEMQARATEIVGIFAEFARACPDLNTEMMAQALKKFLRADNRKSFLASGPFGGARSTTVFLESTFSPLHDFLASHGVSALRVLAQSNAGALSAPIAGDAQAAVEVIAMMPNPSGRIGFDRFWCQGALTLAGVDFLLTLDLDDEDRYILYLAFDDARFRSAIESETVLESMLTRELGL